MREALSLDRLKAVYRGVSGHYDFQHGLITAHSDERGRTMVVRDTIHPGDHVLDAGAGTGITTLHAARAVGSTGHITAFDLSADMLAMAEQKARKAGLSDKVTFLTGDMIRLPFPDASFDAVLSTYSICPLYDPAAGALELYRVLRPGGRLGVAHSSEPQGRLTRLIADAVESVAWRLPWLSMGCRAVSVFPALVDAGARVVWHRRFGVPLWPFEAFLVEKPS